MHYSERCRYYSVLSGWFSCLPLGASACSPTRPLLCAERVVRVSATRSVSVLAYATVTAARILSVLWACSERVLSVFRACSSRVCHQERRRARLRDRYRSACSERVMSVFWACSERVPSVFRACSSRVCHQERRRARLRHADGVFAVRRRHEAGDVPEHRRGEPRLPRRAVWRRLPARRRLHQQTAR